MAEEVKNQFSESISGGLSIFSRAMGVSNKEFLKMMENGELMAKDVLPLVSKEMAKMAREGGALDKSLKGNAIAMSRMMAAFQDMKNQFFQAGFADLSAKTFEAITDAIHTLTPVLNILSRALNTAFTLLTLPIRLVFAVLSDLFDLVGFEGTGVLSKFIGTMTGLVTTFLALRWAIAGLNAVMAASMLPMVAKFAGMAATALTALIGLPAVIALAVAAALSVIYTYWDDITGYISAGWNSLFGDDINVATSSGDVGGALASSAAQQLSSANTVNVEVGLKSDMLDLRVDQRVNEGISNVGNGLMMG